MTSPSSANSTVLYTRSGIEVIRRVCPLHPDGVLRHTVVIAGQHGSERGTVLGLLARGAYDLVERATHGLVTVVRCANPRGFAIGRRHDADWRDPNRLWAIDHDLEGEQYEIWHAILDGELLYEGALSVELVVLDLHSSTEPALARTVCYSGTGLSGRGGIVWAVAAAEHLQRTAHASHHDRAWMALSLADAVEAVRATVPSVTSKGSLAEFVASHDGVCLTVEFPSTTHDVGPQTLYPLERSIGEQIVVPYPGEGRMPQRELTLNEATAGVAGLVRWALDRQNRA